MIKKFEAYHNNQKTFDGQSQVNYRVELLQKGASAGHTEITLPNPVEIKTVSASKQDTKIVVGSELVFSFLTETPETYATLFESEYGDWRIDYYNDDTDQLIWRGYVQPDNLAQDIFYPFTEIVISATDALKDLSETDFDNFTGRRSPMSIIKDALTPLALPFDFKIKLNTHETTQPSTELCLLNTLITDARFVREKDGVSDVDSCLDVIEKILKPFQGVRLQQVEGKYIITNTNEPASFEYSLDWSTLTPTRSAVNDVVNIDAKKYRRNAELSKVSPIKKLDLTFLNSNPGFTLVDNLNDYTVSGPWQFGFTNYETHPITGELVVNVGSDIEDPPPGEPAPRYMLLDSTFQVEQLTENDQILFEFDFRNVSETGIHIGDADRGAVVEAKITGPATNTTQRRVVTTYQGMSVTVPVAEGTGSYNVRLELILVDPDAVYQGEFRFKDFDIRRLVDVEGELQADITFDRMFKFESNKGKRAEEDSLVFGDSGTTGDLGRFEVEVGGDIIGTLQWNRYNKADAESIITLYGKEYLKRNSEYQDYLSIDVWDFDYDITPKNIIQFDGRQYTIESYRRGFGDNLCSLRLREIILIDPTVSVTETDLTSVDGESRGRPGVVIPTPSNTVLHDMDDPAYHRPSSEADYGKPVRANPDTGAIEFESIGSEYVSMETDSTPFALKHWYDYTQSAGRLYGGKITNNLDGTVHIAPGAGIIKSMPGSPADGEDCELSTCPSISENIFINWAEVAALALTDNAYNYIYYEGSTGTIKTTTNFYTVNFTQDFTIGRVYRTGTNVVVRLCGTNLWNFNRRVQLFGEERFPVERARGLMIGYSGRNISLTEGILWAELVNRFVIEAFNSSVTPFTYWYNDGAWQSVSANLISNTQYNNFGVGLANLVGSRYATHWVYAVHDSTIHVVYGRESHSNLASALNEPIPTSLPGLLSAYATFVGRVIIQNGQDILQADSPFIESFAVAGVTDHNDLANIGEDDHHNRLHSMTSALDHETEIANAGKVFGADETGAVVAKETEQTDEVEFEELPIEELPLEELLIEDALTGHPDKLVTSFAIYQAILAMSAGLQPKTEAHAATTENITLSGIQTIDGVTGAADLRILVKDQTTNKSQNGLYLMKSGDWVRTADADEWDKLRAAYVLINDGTVNKFIGYYCDIIPEGTLETDDINWFVFSRPGDYSVQNVGTGEGFFQQQDGFVFKFRSLKSNHGAVTITTDGNEISIDIESEATSEVATESAAEVDTQGASEIDTEQATEIDTEQATEIDTEQAAEVDTETTGEVDLEELPTEPTGEVDLEELSTEPAGEVETEQTEEVLTEPTAEVDTEGVTETDTEPTSEISTETTGEVSTESATEADTESTGEVETESTGEVDLEPTQEVDLEPTGEIDTEGVGEVDTESTSEADTEQADEVETEPAAEINTESTGEVDLEELSTAPAGEVDLEELELAHVIQDTRPDPELYKEGNTWTSQLLNATFELWVDGENREWVERTRQ